DLEWKKVVFTLWPHDRDRFAQTITGFSVKTDKYNYVQWTRLATNEVLAAELYDHSNDTLETVNVVDLPAYREAVLVMRELLEAGWQQAIPIHR
ncbi:MAG: hypothetical protein KJO70_04650, partial [Gammaproteobacteria bacterium]|nr:hypothetical protein [Gammaproteobacteria bacterium]